ncbi:MAG TPA: hypothetical protein VFN38_17835 [Gemmatimonadaceae bacterium]|nr:hypothetical protein [Gemmatimonadaceae bacterium]
MIGSALRLVSLVATVVVVVSFGLYAIDQAREGSDQTLARLEGGEGSKGDAGRNINQADPPPRIERARERRHSDARELVDDANDIVVKPFSGIADSGSIWAQRGVTALLAFLAFGVALRVLAAYVER